MADSGHDLFDVSGRVALITGASRGTGRAIAQALATAGANGALSNRTQADLLQAAQEIRALDVRTEAFPADVARVPEIQAHRTRVSSVGAGWPGTLSHATVSVGLSP